MSKTTSFLYSLSSDFWSNLGFYVDAETLWRLFGIGNTKLAMTLRRAHFECIRITISGNLSINPALALLDVIRTDSLEITGDENSRWFNPRNLVQKISECNLTALKVMGCDLGSLEKDEYLIETLRKLKSLETLILGDGHVIFDLYHVPSHLKHLVISKTQLIPLPHRVVWPNMQILDLSLRYDQAVYLSPKLVEGAPYCQKLTLRMSMEHPPLKGMAFNFLEAKFLSSLDLRCYASMIRFSDGHREELWEWNVRIGSSVTSLRVSGWSRFNFSLNGSTRSLETLIVKYCYNNVLELISRLAEHKISRLELRGGSRFFVGNYPMSWPDSLRHLKFKNARLTMDGDWDPILRAKILPPPYLQFPYYALPTKLKSLEIICNDTWYGEHGLKVAEPKMPPSAFATNQVGLYWPVSSDSSFRLDVWSCAERFMPCHDSLESIVMKGTWASLSPTALPFLPRSLLNIRAIMPLDDRDYFSRPRELHAATKSLDEISMSKFFFQSPSKGIKANDIDETRRDNLSSDKIRTIDWTYDYLDDRRSSIGYRHCPVWNRTPVPEGVTTLNLNKFMQFMITSGRCLDQDNSDYLSTSSEIGQKQVDSDNIDHEKGRDFSWLNNKLKSGDWKLSQWKWEKTFPTSITALRARGNYPNVHFIHSSMRDVIEPNFVRFTSSGIETGASNHVLSVPISRRIPTNRRQWSILTCPCFLSSQRRQSSSTFDDTEIGTLSSLHVPKTGQSDLPSEITEDWWIESDRIDHISSRKQQYNLEEHQREALESNFSIASVDFLSNNILQRGTPLIRLRLENMNHRSLLQLTHYLSSVPTLKSLEILRSCPFTPLSLQSLHLEARTRLENLVWEAGVLFFRDSCKVSDERVPENAISLSKISASLSGSRLRRCVFVPVPPNEDATLLKELKHHYPLLEECWMLATPNEEDEIPRSSWDTSHPYLPPPSERYLRHRQLAYDTKYTTMRALQTFFSLFPASKFRPGLPADQDDAAASSFFDCFFYKPSLSALPQPPIPSVATDNKNIDFSEMSGFQDPVFAPPAITFTGSLWSNDELSLQRTARSGFIGLRDVAIHLKIVLPVASFYTFGLSCSLFSTWKLPKGIHTLDLVSDFDVIVSEEEKRKFSQKGFAISDQLPKLSWVFRSNNVCKVTFTELPTTLTRISIVSSDRLPRNLFEQLPRALRYLHVFSVPTIVKSSRQIFHAALYPVEAAWLVCPQLLEDLVLPGTVLVCRGGKLHFTDLPKKLKRIVCAEIDETLVLKETAPTNLKILKLGSTTLIDY